MGSRRGVFWAAGGPPGRTLASVDSVKLYDIPSTAVVSQSSHTTALRSAEAPFPSGEPPEEVLRRTAPVSRAVRRTPGGELAVTSQRLLAEARQARRLPLAGQRGSGDEEWAAPSLVWDFLPRGSAPFPA